MSKFKKHTIYKKHTITETEVSKFCRGESYNFIFDKRSGAFARWGKKQEDDPQFSPIGPEILDIEISAGRCQGNCDFCYKENTSNKEIENMDFNTFKNILDKMPDTLTQIAFGICDLHSVKYYRKKKQKK